MQIQSLKHLAVYRVKTRHGVTLRFNDQYVAGPPPATTWLPPPMPPPPPGQQQQQQSSTPLAVCRSITWHRSDPVWVTFFELRGFLYKLTSRASMQS